MATAPRGSGRAAPRLPSCSAAAQERGACGAAAAAGRDPEAGTQRPVPGGRPGWCMRTAPLTPRQRQVTLLRGATARAPPGRGPRDRGGGLRSDFAKLPYMRLSPGAATRGGVGRGWTRPPAGGAGSAEPRTPFENRQRSRLGAEQCPGELPRRPRHRPRSRLGSLNLGVGVGSGGRLIVSGHFSKSTVYLV